jgi:hypothetical protein
VDEVTTGDIPARRARLAALEAALTRLRGHYDLAMSAFKFDEARELTPQIEAADRERAMLAASLPGVDEPVLPIAPRRPQLRRYRRRRR